MLLFSYIRTLWFHRNNFLLFAHLIQVATVEVPENHMGPVVELLGKRRGQMFDMQGVGYVSFLLPSPFKTAS